MALCSVPNCSGEAVAKGLCMKHYQQARRNNIIVMDVKREKCSHPGCNEKVYSKGYCRKHYNQQYYKRRTKT